MVAVALHEVRLDLVASSGQHRERIALFVVLKWKNGNFIILLEIENYIFISGVKAKVEIEKYKL